MKLVDDEDATPGAPRAITPKTKFTVSLGTALLILIGLLEAGRFVFSTWSAVTTKLDSHIADKDRHLDAEYRRVHGEPVGKNDLDLAQVNLAKSVDDFRGQVHLEVTRALEAPSRRNR